MDFATLMDKGGPVMWVLFAYSMIAVSIVLERFIHFMFMPKERKLLAELEQVEGKHSSPETEVLKGIQQAANEGVRDLARVASRISSEQITRMEYGLRTLAWLGNTAPLLGLFGTITGMIKAFMVIEAAGGKVDAQALAGGIWEAMTTTGAGLAVAIPVLFLLHLLEGMVDQRAKSMQQAASLMLEQLPHSPEGAENDQILHQSSLSHAV